MRKWLKEAREAKGMSQSDVAREVDVVYQTILNIEKGKSDPSVGLACAIGRILDVDPLLFMTSESDRYMQELKVKHVNIKRRK